MIDQNENDEEYWGYSHTYKIDQYSTFLCILKYIQLNLMALKNIHDDLKEFDVYSY